MTMKLRIYTRRKQLAKLRSYGFAGDLPLHLNAVIDEVNRLRAIVKRLLRKQGR